jgi:hypothetical protein
MAMVRGCGGNGDFGVRPKKWFSKETTIAKKKKLVTRD